MKDYYIMRESLNIMDFKHCPHCGGKMEESAKKKKSRRKTEKFNLPNEYINTALLHSEWERTEIFADRINKLITKVADLEELEEYNVPKTNTD